MIQLYILTKDRPNELKEALISAINQDSKEIEIIVSDNSEMLETSQMMADNFSNIHYIKRVPHLEASEHSRVVIEESSAEYVMLFHDDDILEPTHVSDILSKFQKYPDLVAAASNGTYIGDFFLDNREIMNLSKDVVIERPKEIFEYYLGLHPSGSSIPPLSGYIYKASILKEVNRNFDNKCGKHADVQTLSEVLEFGNVLWLSKKTILYRVHSGQHSASEKILDRNKLLRFMLTNGIDINSKGVVYFKFMYLLGWWKKNNNSTFRIPLGFKERIVAKFLVYSFLNLLFSKIFISKIFRLLLFLVKKKF
jgi:glycosyltransferase involved in cell wall biosynthesis